MLTSLAEYVAPAATMIAACMTAANLGPRVTGWGFVVFTMGSLAWSAIALSTGQHSLLLTNIFLTMVNVIGIWRWLGRIARFDDGAKVAETKSRQTEAPTITNISAIEGRAVKDRSGAKIGSAIGVMAVVETGTIAYIVAGLGGVAGLGERLVAIPWRSFKIADEVIEVQMTCHEISDLPDLDPADWPEQARLN